MDGVYPSGCMTWPESLPSGRSPPLDGERNATAAEHAAAHSIVGAACTAHDLAHVETTVVLTRQPLGEQREQRLAALVVGKRWPFDTRRKVKPVELWITEI